MATGDSRHPRLRVVSSPEELEARPPAAREAGSTCLLVRGAAAGGGGTREVMARAVPWFGFWQERKKSFDRGLWRCTVDTPDGGAAYAGTVPAHLPLHCDMTRYRHPPELTAIRCLEPDPGGGGANVLVHVDDALARLRADGEQRLLAFLTTPRRINLRGGEHAVEPLVTEGDAAAPSRVFDVDAATKGSHVDLGDEEVAALKEFVALATSWEDVRLEVLLAPGDVVVFSNYRFLHARRACAGTGRTTDVCLGFPTGDPQGARPREGVA